MPRAEHLERDEDPEAARTNLAAARSQTAEYRQELALRLIERSLSSHRSDRRSDVALRICDYLPHRPCRKRGRSRRNRAVGRITKTDEKATTTPGPRRRRVIRSISPRGSRSEEAIGADARKGYGLLFIGLAVLIDRKCLELNSAFLS